ncbi:uncharacterized protein C8Q71DRAFT_722939 [Rhodofomes roseus]|uniref:Uncharacterized protein n=1 Tax=Rhodofomes roseus TaxID=34475 RepID=A0ABQ8KHZ8_9APHY|nr:uncharacterized protein C8Q71DRAFT_722939 [Rhodofomes roseus]KAH9837598.1 hypothetical protein C8Q71DRAFT_722939 [Rhodofomes roseus]
MPSQHVIFHGGTEWTVLSAYGPEHLENRYTKQLARTTNALLHDDQRKRFYSGNVPETRQYFGEYSVPSTTYGDGISLWGRYFDRGVADAKLHPRPQGRLKDYRAVARGTTVNKPETSMESSPRRATYVSIEDEILQTSAGVGGADYVYGRAFQRAVGSGRPAPHRHTDSESTESTASLEIVQEGSEDVARPRTKTWTDFSRLSINVTTEGGSQRLLDLRVPL